MPGGKPDMTDPIILAKGSNLEAAAAPVHKEFARKLKYARIWGSGKHDGVSARRRTVTLQPARVRCMISTKNRPPRARLRKYMKLAS